jgi:hypothetical protein
MPEDREPLKQYYLQRLEEALGTLDRREFETAWDLSWRRVFAQLGSCLVDSLVGEHTAQDLARVRGLCGRAIQRARRIVDIHVR